MNLMRCSRRNKYSITKALTYCKSSDVIFCFKSFPHIIIQIEALKGQVFNFQRCCPWFQIHLYGSTEFQSDNLLHYQNTSLYLFILEQNATARKIRMEFSGTLALVLDWYSHFTNLPTFNLQTKIFRRKMICEEAPQTFAW